MFLGKIIDEQSISTKRLTT